MISGWTLVLISFTEIFIKKEWVLRNGKWCWIWALEEICLVRRLLLLLLRLLFDLVISYKTRLIAKRKFYCYSYVIIIIIFVIFAPIKHNTHTYMNELPTILSTCPICGSFITTNITPREQAAICLPCGHLYHDECAKLEICRVIFSSWVALLQ